MFAVTSPQPSCTGPQSQGVRTVSHSRPVGTQAAVIRSHPSQAQTAVPPTVAGEGVGEAGTGAVARVLEVHKRQRHAGAHLLRSHRARIMQ